MRDLNVCEMDWISGGGDATVTVGTGGASVEVKSDTKSLGQALIETYEGLVEATSHIIERVANVFK